ncbi:NupC/NupG family nucleoside CNT transporter [Candidatus Synechococcus calcipolaris G9]|uniref:NupC/NupG family nucleoside CNT transporter n=1 Tax=Candidatus Synechococcus calcipolaris G9 TaxID=1497997 RepID=A0ABT6EXG6_9SYNE|nr:nucleoside transporter C-terminal domain-containing protein [Candidatus Synechococcus calcipolaris]MDG2990437.1 NupC/NupG family nucleoside CNT transporter [Candidatus Synechococcus calcipolaris G9]
MERLISLLGLFVFIGIAYALSVKRAAINWRTLLWGVALQISIGVIILRLPIGYQFFQALGNGIGYFLNFSDVGAEFVFGPDFADHFIAFKVMPTIIFFSSFITILYHYGILQRVVQWLSVAMVKTMKTSGSESLVCAANVFVGPAEAPLLVKPYVKDMTLSELHAIMTCGFATIAGGVMAAYISLGIPAEHLIAASVMSAPAALGISKVMYPETDTPLTLGDHGDTQVQRTSINVIDAATIGALDGMKLALNIVALLIAFTALVAAINGLLQVLGGWINFPQLSLEWIFSFVFAPIAWLMGVPWQDVGQVGILLGKKTVLNEFFAYLDLSALMNNAAEIAAGEVEAGTVPVISQRSQILATYALCGFSSLTAIGIQIGGIGAIAPSRQHDLARLGLRAMIGGSLACFMTASIAGVLL